MAALWKKLVALANRKRVLHYADIFVAAFGLSLLFNEQHIEGDHGLNAVKSAVFAACVCGGKAVVEAYRKSAGPPS